jgi:hypothetical protein
VLYNPAGDVSKLVEKLVAKRRTAALFVVRRLVLELSDGVVEQLDAEHAGAHLPSDSKLVENSS